MTVEKFKLAIDVAKSFYPPNERNIIERYFEAAESVRCKGKPQDMDDDEYVVYVDEQAFILVPGSRSVMERFTDALVEVYQAPSG